ncbi:hypothetical protein QIA30_05215 (plasmid) [Borreliella turdi]|uniref:hypothetical protein n=1 Tax=Borreliella turdi TaxID=57863 RepID=UPI003AEF25B6
MSDFITKLNQSVNNVDNTGYVADSYKKLSKCAALAYIESFNVIFSKFIDNKFIEAYKEFVKTAKEFVEEDEIIDLGYIVSAIGDIVNEIKINSSNRSNNSYKKEADFLIAAIKLERAYKAVK